MLKTFLYCQYIKNVKIITLRWNIKIQESYKIKFHLRAKKLSWTKIKCTLLLWNEFGEKKADFLKPEVNDYHIKKITQNNLAI